MTFLIKNPGILSTVQDLGRFGYQSSGIVPAGALDYKSAILANQLVGNDPNAAVIEMSFQGITFESLVDTIIAVAGAPMKFTINGQEFPIGRGLQVAKDDVVEIGYTEENMRTYLAVSGGFKVEEVLGSASTHTRSNMGGYKGRALKAGDRLLTNGRVPDEKPRTLRKYLDFSDSKIRIVKGPDYDIFTDESKEILVNQHYEISKNSDRMGIRLHGEADEKIETTTGAHDILSEPTQLGNVQVPKSGQPIILLSDRQTTGGYTRIATVARVDLPKLVQLRPGQKIQFELIDLELAIDLYKEELRKIYGKEYLKIDTDYKYHRRIKAERVKKLLLR